MDIRNFFKMGAAAPKRAPDTDTTPTPGAATAATASKPVTPKEPAKAASPKKARGATGTGSKATATAKARAKAKEAAAAQQEAALEISDSDDGAQAVTKPHRRAASNQSRTIGLDSEDDADVGDAAPVLPAKRSRSSPGSKATTNHPSAAVASARKRAKSRFDSDSDDDIASPSSHGKSSTPSAPPKALETGKKLSTTPEKASPARLPVSPKTKVEDSRNVGHTPSSTTKALPPVGKSTTPMAFFATALKPVGAAKGGSPLTVQPSHSAGGVTPTVRTKMEVDDDLPIAPSLSDTDEDDKSVSHNLARSTGSQEKPRATRTSPHKSIKTEPSADVVSAPAVASPDKRQRREPDGDRLPEASRPKDGAKTSTATTEKVSREEAPSQGAKLPEEDTQRKRAATFRAFMARAGPAQPGSKPLPVGEPNCLQDLTFVFSGELESTARDQAEDLVKRYGGDAGQKKLEEAQRLNTKVIDEDAFLDLIRTRPAQADKPLDDSHGFQNMLAKLASPQKATALSKATPTASDGSSATVRQLAQSYGQSAPTSVAPTTSSAAAKSSGSATQSSNALGNELWTEKYRPQSRKDLIGNPGMADKLFSWLKAWVKHRRENFKGKEEGASNRAVLLSGPPGIGKTSTAHVIAKEAGYEPIEFNASDTRSKKSLELHISDLISNRSVSEFYSGPAAGRPVVLIMDEVDGMSGGDRAGMGELIRLIKKSKVPIICICNDASSPKVRSLQNYCLHLRFRRPEARVVAAKLRTVAFREKLNLDQQSLEHLVTGAHADIRQVLNLLSTFRLTATDMSYDQAKELMAKSMKNLSMSPFDLIGKLLSAGHGADPSLDDMLNYYFYDFSIMPLMIQENYVRCRPLGVQGDLRGQLKHLQLLSKAADSIALGDCVSRIVSGWLGKNSTQTKLHRLLRELHLHMSLKVSADRSQLRESYLPYLQDALLRPLLSLGQDGIDETISVMDSYYLNREDIDSLLEVNGGLGRASADPMAAVPSQVKSAFTRKYNSGHHPLPYSLVRIAVTRGAGAASGGALEGLAQGEGEEELEAETEQADDDEDAKEAEEDDVTKDKMIKAKKVTAPRGGASSAAGSAGGRPGASSKGGSGAARGGGGSRNR